jgi:hypothetical protein
MRLHLLLAGFFFGTFFHPEDEGDMFHQNVGWLTEMWAAASQ